jgi:hypothetical protein
VNDVIHVVLVYRREKAQLLLQETYDDGDDAMRRRFVLEQLPEYADTEVVVLSADSIEILHETHGRYFCTDAQLVQRLREAFAAA